MKSYIARKEDSGSREGAKNAKNAEGPRPEKGTVT
jgi:hypothetical protein